MKNTYGQIVIGLLLGLLKLSKQKLIFWLNKTTLGAGPGLAAGKARQHLSTGMSEKAWICKTIKYELKKIIKIFIFVSLSD